MENKKYFHELPQSEIEKLKKLIKGVSRNYLVNKFKQPDWCGYPNALHLGLGCWSLANFEKNGIRTKISKEFCKTCRSFNEK